MPFALVATTLAMVTVCNSSHETQDYTNVRMPSNMPKNNHWWAVVVTGAKYFRQFRPQLPTDIRWHMQPPYVVQGTAYPLLALFDVSIPFESIAINRQC